MLTDHGLILKLGSQSLDITGLIFFANVELTGQQKPGARLQSDLNGL